MPTTDREEALFAAILEKKTRAERAAYLEDACGADHALRERIEALLAAHDASDGVLDALPHMSTTAPPPLAEKPGTIIGPYKLLQQIGEGGMGVVYMAEQQEPVRRKVALKIIKPGMDSRQVIARFEAERQALAMMDHQNIARVLDAGTTESGRPYFVMELVHGVPITRFCDDNKLTPRERLALFVPVCQAIQHAHQKGIIHRDVKPSNVLVTMYDDKPVPKVIDFGVAKAIEQRLTEKTMFTQFGALVGTFEYMSPEQAEMNAFGVDTRSDIYSLGVLLYELLTGTTPLERARLRAAALDEMVRLIREEEAPRPSVRLSSSNNLPKIAAARKTEPARLSKLVRGEIDWIVMKCLEKDRSRRYETANAMARDLERFLADEPVEACPPSSSYRLRKFAGKHKKALATATAFMVLLVAGAVMSTLLAWWATSAEREANRQRVASDEAKQEALNAKQEALDAKVAADRQRDEVREMAYASGIGLARRAWEENNIVRARELLEEVPKEAAGRNLRGFEWYYLNRLCHFDLMTIKGHTNSVNSVAFSPDGRRIASASGESVRVWDADTGKEAIKLKGLTSDVHTFQSVAFSPDGCRIASASGVSSLVSARYDPTVKVWDADTGEETLTIKIKIKRQSPDVASVAFSPDGRRIVSASGDETVKVWDAVTGKETLTIKGHTKAVFSVAFSPDGRRIASASRDTTVRIWDASTGQEMLSLNGRNFVHSVAFSPDGHRIASGSADRKVKIWDTVTGQETLTIRGHTNGVTSVAFSPDGRRIASASWDKTVKVWDAVTGQETLSLKGHTGIVDSVAFSPDGRRIASGSYDETMKVWDAVTRQEMLTINGHTRIVTSVAFSPDGRRIASASADGKVKVWDAVTRQEMLTIKGHTNGVTSVAFSPDGRRIASASGDQTVKVWDAVTGQETLTFKGHTKGVESVAFSPDGCRIASASEDQTVKVWDAVTGQETLTLKGHTNAVFSVAFSPDGHRIASVSRGTVKVWEAVTGKEMLSLAGDYFVDVTSVAFTPDGRRIASAGDDHTVNVWDAVTGQEALTIEGHTAGVKSVAFTPDGRRIASASRDQTVKVWDAVSGQEWLSLEGHSVVTSVAFSPDGRRLASGNDDGSINLWETSVSAEVQDGWAANQMVADLFRQMGFRASVLERLRTLPDMSPSRRREALAAAQSYPENPETLNNLAWELVKLPGRAMSDYLKAVRLSERACQLEPKNRNYRNTLGAAYYRVGNFNKALETLRRSDLINEKEYQGSRPADRAFLAMTHHQLGHAKEAQAELQRLRERMKDPRWAQDAEAQGFLREAEALLAMPMDPSGK